jgi:hypothetical protein
MAMKCVRLRLIWLASLALLASPGCRTGGLGNLAGPAPPVMPRTSPDVRRLLADHNRNAARIRTIDAKPGISISAGRGLSGGVDGMLALERPRNFKLRLKHTGGEVADIGSNDDEFWIWTKDSEDKAVYFCKYDSEGNCPLAGELQPDWIIEALGLRVIPDDEIDQITVARGKEPDTLVLTHRPARMGAGESVVRVTVLTESTRRVREYQLWTVDRKTKLAQAQIKQYLDIVPQGSTELVYIPLRLRVDWYRGKRLTMEATFAEDSTTVNRQFSEDFRAAVFVEPTPPGYARKDLAREAGVAGRTSATTIRETLPAPPSGSGVQLGEPEEPAPIGTEAASRTPRDPIALSADLPAVPSLSSQVVGAPIPKPPAPEFQSGNWRPVAGPSYER